MRFIQWHDAISVEVLGCWSTSKNEITYMYAKASLRAKNYMVDRSKALGGLFEFYFWFLECYLRLRGCVCAFSMVTGAILAALLIVPKMIAIIAADADLKSLRVLGGFEVAAQVECGGRSCWMLGASSR